MCGDDEFHILVMRTGSVATGSDSNPDDDPAHADLRTRGGGHVTSHTQERVCTELDTELVLETWRGNRD